ncbi:MAG: hypothetical protein JSU86_05855 [Phycisphaerales bacterium]|nr:MAG: hypothetical protein JSU86_05855 [Phycisphaerales bacterium]
MLRDIAQGWKAFLGQALLVAGVVVAFQASRGIRAQRPVEGERAISQPAHRSTWALRDSEAAIARARKLLGLPAGGGSVATSAELSVLEEDNTPYLSKQLIDSPLWQVVVRDWSLKLKSAPTDAKDEYVRTVDVFLDPQKGHLLKMRSRWPVNEPRIAPEPSAAVAEDQFRAGSDERYHGFPDDAPKITFLDALDGMYRGGVSAFGAKQIVAQCVIRSTMFDERKVVWAITLRGVTPYRPRAGWPRDARYEYRYIVDAVTGTYESASNRPRPISGVTATAGGIYSDRCSSPMTHRHYVSSCLRQVQNGADREEVLDTLMCIARTHQKVFDFGPAAVASIFALAESEAKIREYLLELTGNPETNVGVHKHACGLLVYVADEEVQRVLLDQLKTSWPGDHWSGYFEFFKDVGDPAFLSWLEGLEAQAQGEVPSSAIQRQLRYVRIQQTVDGLLGYLQSDAKDLDLGWVARQALRRGASGKQIRQALLQRLRREGNQEPTLLQNPRLLLDWAELGVFTVEDQKEFPAIGAMARSRVRPPVDDGASVERRIMAKRAEFWGIIREATDGK